MSTKAITFSVAPGSGGHDVARAVAESLKFDYYDWEITHHVATRVGAVPEEVAASVERAPSWASRIIEQLALTGRLEAGLPNEPGVDTLRSALNSLSQDKYRELIAQVVLQLGRRGNAVIVGHVAQLTLQSEPGVLKVLVYGSEKVRAARLASESIAAGTQRSSLARLDQERNEFFRKVHHVDWRDVNLYDLAISTDRLDTADAASLVSLAAGLEADTTQAASAST